MASGVSAARYDSGPATDDPQRPRTHQLDRRVLHDHPKGAGLGQQPCLVDPRALKRARRGALDVE